MKRVSLIVKCVVILLSVSSLSHSQDSTKSIIKFGIGISSSIFLYSTYQMPDLNNTALSVPIFIYSLFKLEPFVVFSQSRSEIKTNLQ